MPVRDGGLEIKDRKHNMNQYHKCFLGSEFVSWLLRKGYASDTNVATQIGQSLVEENLMIHVKRDHQFKNEALFYRFLVHERDRGHALNGNKWYDIAPEDFKEKEIDQKVVTERMKDLTDLFKNCQSAHIYPMLFDEASCAMYDNVRPANWVDPALDEGDQYDMLVIGGGAAGLYTAAGSAIYGAKTCMIERGMIGGDCLVTGCVPSKAFLTSAAVAKKFREGGAEHGISIEGEVKIDFKKLMGRMRNIRTEISKNDAAKVFTDKYGIDVYLGNAKFKSRNTVEVNGKELKFTKACIATGGRPSVPKYPGLDKVKIYSSDNVFNLNVQPEKLLVLGAGPIGCELG